MTAADEEARSLVESRSRESGPITDGDDIGAAWVEQTDTRRSNVGSDKEWNSERKTRREA